MTRLNHTLDETKLPADAPGRPTPARLPHDGRYRVNYHHGVNPFVWEQISGLESITEYQDNFHYPYPHNYVLIALPRERVMDDYLKQIRETFASLNDADGALLTFFAQYVNSGAADRIIATWRERRSRGLNLEGVRYAEQLTALMGEGSLMSTIALRQPDLINRFLNIPDSIKQALRINVYIPMQDVQTCLSRVIAAISTMPDWQGGLDRIEVAKAGLKSEGAESFPTLIIYPTHNSPLLDRIKEALNDCPQAPIPDHTYAEVWTHNSTYSQGFRLYKRYLSLLGQLDCVYDVQSQYSKLLAYDI